MTTLATKYGPAEDGPASATQSPEGRLEAYTRIARAAQEARGGPLRAPVARLSAEQLSGLYAPRQLGALVGVPLARAAPDCG